MTAEQYTRWTAPLRAHPRLTKCLLTVNKLITYTIYAAYPLFLLTLAASHDTRLWRVFVVPALSFVVLSVFRDRYNAPRPYEILVIQPLIHKDTKGHSFPSRHVFSATVIGMTFLSVHIGLGIVVLLCAVFLSVMRVLGGVHFPKDVLCGLILGVLAGSLCFFQF